MSDSQPFRLLDLPVELQVQVMKCDPVLTKCLIHASQQASAVYVKNSTTILTTFFNRWPSQLRNLMLGIMGLCQDDKTLKGSILDLGACIYLGWELQPQSNAKTPWKRPKHLGNQDGAQFVISRFQDMKSFRPIRFLDMLCRLLMDLDICTEIFADHTLTQAYKTFKAPLTSHLSLTTTERYRIQRALLRCWLYGSMDRTGWPMAKKKALQGKLCSWEMEELVSMIDFFEDLLRPVTNFRSAYSTVSYAMDSNKYFIFFARSTCLKDMSSLLFRDLDHPLHLWKDAKSANEKGYGFQYARGEVNERASDVEAKTCRFRLRGFGFFYWDKERIDSWEELPKSRECGNSGDLVMWARLHTYVTSSGVYGDGQTLGEARAALRSYILEIKDWEKFMGFKGR